MFYKDIFSRFKAMFKNFMQYLTKFPSKIAENDLKYD